MGGNASEETQGGAGKGNTALGSPQADPGMPQLGELASPKAQAAAMSAMDLGALDLRGKTAPVVGEEGNTGGCTGTGEHTSGR